MFAYEIIITLISQIDINKNQKKLMKINLIFFN